VPADFPTIQDAVERAAPGDTIRVAGGVYEGAVFIEGGKDRLAIIGSGPGNSILQGVGDGPGFRISNSSHVTIAGFTVTGFFFGVLVFLNSTDNTIHDVTATDCQVGFAVLEQEAGRNLFFNVAGIRNRGNGLATPSPLTYVIGGEFRGNPGTGVSLSTAACYAIGNRISGNGNGLGGEFNLQTFVIDNHVSGNTFGIMAEAPLTFGNSATRNLEAGFIPSQDIPVLALENEISCNQGVGVRVFTGNAIKFIFNQIENNGLEGVALDANSVGGVIDDNKIEGNGASGVRLDAGARDNAVRRNVIKGNNPDIAVQAPAGTGNVFDENRCATSVPAGLCPCDD